MVVCPWLVSGKPHGNSERTTDPVGLTTKYRISFWGETFHDKRNSHFTITFVFIWAAALQKNRSVIWKQHMCCEVHLILCCPPKLWPKVFNNVVIMSIDQPLLEATAASKNSQVGRNLERSPTLEGSHLLELVGMKRKWRGKQQHCYSIWLMWTHLVYGRRSARLIKPEGCWALGRLIGSQRRY